MGKALTCFVIGPMGEAEGVGSRARLVRLKDNVIRPVLERVVSGTDDNYNVVTPFDLGLYGGASIVKDVIYAIDRADMVVADLSNGNPNVFYELGITHALGRPCVAVLQEGQSVEFDVNAYRVFYIDLRSSRSRAADEAAYSRARDALYVPLRAAHLATDDWSKLENPVIDYYHAPMTYVSPAPALAEGYFVNFVLPVVESLTEAKGDQYFFDVGIADIGPNMPNSLEQTRPLTASQRERLDLNIVVPARVELAKRDWANRLRGQAHPALVETKGRTLTMWAYEGMNGSYQLLDIPTTMRGVESAVDRRMRFKERVNHDSEEWRNVEAQEVARFMLMLQTSISTRLESSFVRRRVRVIRSDLLGTDPRLLWLDTLLPLD